MAKTIRFLSGRLNMKKLYSTKGPRLETAEIDRRQATPPPPPARRQSPYTLAPCVTPGRDPFCCPPPPTPKSQSTASTARPEDHPAPGSTASPSGPARPKCPGCKTQQWLRPPRPVPSRVHDRQSTRSPESPRTAGSGRSGPGPRGGLRSGPGGGASCCAAAPRCCGARPRTCP